MKKFIEIFSLGFVFLLGGCFFDSSGLRDNDSTTTTSNFVQIQKIGISGANEYDYYGQSVFISGSYAVVGSSGDNDKAYLYNKLSNDIFEQKQILNSSSSVKLGNCVDMWGEYILVADMANDYNGSQTGALYIFKKDGNDDFDQFQKLVANDSVANNKFGNDISMYDDYIAVASSYDDSNSTTDNGSVYIYQKQDGNYTQIQKLTPNNPQTSQRFGKAISIYDKYLAISSNIGSVYIYQKQDDGNYTNTQELSNSSSTHFGASIDLYDQFLAIGDYSNSYIYKRQDDGNYTISQTLAINSSSYPLSVEIDQDYMIVGAYQDGDYGQAIVYKKQDDNFSKTQTLTPTWPSSSGGYFGKSIKISGDYLIIGSPKESYDNTNQSGAIYIFKNK